eukprot:4729078-Prymnesium_polylepis.1
MPSSRLPIEVALVWSSVVVTTAAYPVVRTRPVKPIANAMSQLPEPLERCDRRLFHPEIPPAEAAVIGRHQLFGAHILKYERDPRNREHTQDEGPQRWRKRLERLLDPLPERHFFGLRLDHDHKLIAIQCEL